MESLVPPMLSAGVSSVAEIPGDWFLVHVRSHHEKAIAWQLAENGFDYYLPLTQVRKKTASRNTVTLSLALFDGYLFAAASPEPDGQLNFRLLDFLTEHQHVFIDEYWGKVVNRYQLVGDLLLVEAALRDNPSLRIETIERKGQKVRVTRGWFKNAEGVVEGFGGKSVERVYILIKTMGQFVPMDIDRSDLELL